MVGTEYGMAWEMTHGLAAGCVSCIADQSVRERERGVYAYGRTNKEASIGVVSEARTAEVGRRWAMGERSWREMEGTDERRGEREREVNSRLALCHKPPAREHSSGKYS